MYPNEIGPHSRPGDPRPIELVGAGRLISNIWKLGGVDSGWRYRFNVVRQSSDHEHFTDLFQPNDLIHLIKLIQVLAAVIADDGCLSQPERIMLRRLAVRLDEFLGDECSPTNEDPTPNSEPSLHND
jgi:hypothetical protein